MSASSLKLIADDPTVATVGEIRAYQEGFLAGQELCLQVLKGAPHRPVRENPMWTELTRRAEVLQRPRRRSWWRSFRDFFLAVPPERSA